MNKLALTAIMVGGLLQTSGCIITTDDDPTGGLLEVTWPVAACSSTTATVYTLNTATDEMFMDAYVCSEGTTVTEPGALLLPVGNYTVWVEIQNDTMTRSHARSLTQTVSFTADGQAATIATVPLALAQGHFELSWTIANASGTTLDCGEAGAGGGVKSVATFAADSTVSVSNTYTCSDFTGLSPLMPPGLYTIAVELLDGVDEQLGSYPAFEETVIGDYIINLGIFDFEVTP